jgi:hypothetical protein
MHNTLQATVSNARRVPLTSVDLYLLLVIFLLFLFQTDFYALGITGELSGLGAWLNIDPDRVGALMGPLVCLSIFPFLFDIPKDQSKNGSFKLVFFSAALIVVSGIAKLVSMGDSPVNSLRSTGISSLCLFITLFAAVQFRLKSQAFRLAIMPVLAMAGGIRLAEALVSYRSTGGVSFVTGVQSLTADGPLLALWGCIAAWALFEAVNRFDAQKKINALMFAVIAAIFLLGIVASFRRNALGRVIALVLLGIFVQNRRVGKTWRGAIGMIGAGAAGAICIGTLSVYLYGIETSLDRLRSFSFSEDSAFSDSNKQYIEDWEMLSSVFLNNPIFGVGPGVSYGIARDSDQNIAASYVPFHTGSAELLASFGMMALPLLIAVLISIPIFHIYRSSREETIDSIGVLAIAYASFIGLWPFGPPFYTNFHISALAAIFFSIVVFEKRGATMSLMRSGNGRVLKS